jgi:hypothetical protein
MPLNPSIALGVQPQQAQGYDPMRTLQGLMQMDAMRDQQRYRQVQVKALEDAQRGEEVFRQVVMRRTRSTGVPDWDEVVNELHSLGEPDKALDLQSQIAKVREEEATSALKSLDTTKAKWALGTAIVRAMRAEAEGVEDPATLKTIFDKHKGELVKVVGAETAAKIGDRYDPKVLAAAEEYGLTAEQSAQRQRDAVARITETRLGGKQKEESDQQWSQSAWDGLSSATNQQEWTKVLTFLDGQGLPAYIRRNLPEEFSPQNLQFATSMALGADKRLGHQAKKIDQKETERHHRAIEQDADADRKLQERRLDLEEGDKIDLSPEALEQAAIRFAKTGVLMSTGMGKHANAQKTKIVNRAAELYGTLDLADQQAAYTANVQALKTLTTDASKMKAFKDTAVANAKVFLEQAKKIQDTGSPYLNKPIREMDEKLLGSPQMAAFNTARQTVVPEFARILQSYGGTGVLTDTARKEIDTILSPTATLPQIVSSLNVLTQDIENREKGMNDTIEAIQKRIRTKPGETSMSSSSGDGSTEVEDTMNGWVYKVKKDKAGNFISAVPLRPAK